MLYTDRLSGKEFKVEIVGEVGSQHYKVKGPDIGERTIHKNDLRAETEAYWRVVAIMSSIRGGYQIKKSNHGSYSCQCKGFEFHRKCKHLSYYLELM